MTKENKQGKYFPSIDISAIGGSVNSEDKTQLIME